MKGRRKVKTNKWALAAQYKAEAQAIFEQRGESANRFLDIAVKHQQAKKAEGSV